MYNLYPLQLNANTSDHIQLCHMDQLQYSYSIHNWLFCALHQVLTLKQTLNMVIVSQQSLYLRPPSLFSRNQ